MRLWMLATVLAAAAGVAAAQQPAPLTAQQVATRSLDARGGAARFAALRSLSFTGHLDLGGGKTAPLTVWLAARPYRIRVELTLPEGKLVQGFDGVEAWQIAPGKTLAEVLTGAEATQVRDQALGFADLLANPEAKLALAGQGSADGHDYYQLTITLATGDVFTQYIDARTWRAYHEAYPGGVEDISDYRQVQGLWLPFRYVSGPVGQPGSALVRDSVQINPQLAPSLFVRPQ